MRGFAVALTSTALAWPGGACLRLATAKHAKGQHGLDALSMRFRLPWKELVLLSKRSNTTKLPSLASHRLRSGAGMPWLSTRLAVSAWKSCPQVWPASRGTCASRRTWLASSWSASSSSHALPGPKLAMEDRLLPDELADREEEPPELYSGLCGTHRGGRPRQGGGSVSLASCLPAAV